LAENFSSGTTLSVLQSLQTNSLQPLQEFSSSDTRTPVKILQREFSQLDSANNFVLYHILSAISNDDSTIDIAENVEGEEGQEQPDLADNVDYTPLEALRECHNSRIGHHGSRRTWLALNKFFPGHRIPFRVVSEFVAECAICQKDRLTDMKDSLKPLVRHLKRPGPRSRIGIDTLTITPPDIHGNQYLTVIVNMFTKLVAGYPSKEHDAKVAASALYKYFSTYGLVDEIISDPGSEFMNEVIKHLLNWFGVTHLFSLVDRHESNGVEPTNREILRHLKALVMDERLLNQWSDDSVLPAVFMVINGQVSSESGVIPFHAHFGNQNATYHKVPEGLDQRSKTNEYVKLLSANLDLISDLSKQYQDQLVQDRIKDSLPEYQNQFQPGDFVLFQMNPEQHLPFKLHPRFKGPYEVVAQYKNDVECRSLIYDSISKFHVSRLKMFYGSEGAESLREQALKLAMIDDNQYKLKTIHAYRGDIERRSTLTFYAEFADEEKRWVPYSTDLFQTEQYELFCDRNPELILLKVRTEEAKAITREINNTAITEVDVNDSVWVDLRQYGCEWYESLQLPDYEFRKYVILFTYQKWKGNDHKKIVIKSDLTLDEWTVNHLWVKQFGTIYDHKLPENAVKIEEQYLIDHPEILGETHREFVLNKCRWVLGL
jgi:hypothetical protein